MRDPSSVRVRTVRPGLVLLLAATATVPLACKGRDRASAGGDVAADTAAATSTPAAAAAPDAAADSARLAAARADSARIDSVATARAMAASSEKAATKPAAKPSAAKPATPAAAAPKAEAPVADAPYDFDTKRSASAIGVSVYPKNNQSANKQHRDENECFDWAQKETGIDYYAAAPAPAATQEGLQGGAVRGAARGAVAGAAIGAIAGDAGTGAAIGATAGGVAGRRRDKVGQQAQAAGAKADAAAQGEQSKQTFRNAFSACIQGRGYSAK